MIEINNDNMPQTVESLQKMMDRVNDKLKNGIYSKCFTEKRHLLEEHNVELFDDVVSLLLDKMSKDNCGFMEDSLVAYIETLRQTEYKFEKLFEDEETNKFLKLYLDGDKSQLANIANKFDGIMIPLRGYTEHPTCKISDEECKSDYQPQSDK